VCTLDAEESDGVVRRLLARDPEFRAAEGLDPVPPRLRAARVVLDAARDGTDGFMLWRLRRVSPA
jgi:16S rRNA C967 or C1407 C5-methylase (RsmB/RsmF family)